MANKIDSNITGLRYAEETSLGVLPGSAIWRPLEPNSYSDFGGQLTTKARDPINASRQRQKGVVSDLEASGGFSHDLTQKGLTRLMQGFFFAALREKLTTSPTNGTAVVLTSVDSSTKQYKAASGLAAFSAGQLVLASGFSLSSNNGLKSVTAAAAGSVTVSNTLATETPPASAKLEVVGRQFAAGELSLSYTAGDWPRLTRASGTFDLTTLGLIPGEWVFVGGDTLATRFDSVGNNGFCRVRAVAADYIELDKTGATPLTEVAGTKTIQLFFGSHLRNESEALFRRFTYQLERTLGSDADGVMSEYLVGAVPNQLTLTVSQADLVKTDFTFMATDNEQRTGAQGVKAGTRPALESSPAFNTSSDFSRIKLHVLSQNGDPCVSPLFAYLTELKLTVNNNVKANKAIAVLGAFDVTAGTFQVSASVTAYFSDITAVQAVRNNADVSLDFAMVKSNAGQVWDMPLATLGDGRLNVAKDAAITLPLTQEAAQSEQGHTLSVTFFPYLPSVAE